MMMLRLAHQTPYRPAGKIKGRTLLRRECTYFATVDCQRCVRDLQLGSCPLQQGVRPSNHLLVDSAVLAMDLGFHIPVR